MHTRERYYQSAAQARRRGDASSTRAWMTAHALHCAAMYGPAQVQAEYAASLDAERLAAVQQELRRRMATVPQYPPHILPVRQVPIRPPALRRRTHCIGDHVMSRTTWAEQQLVEIIATAHGPQPRPLIVSLHIDDDHTLTVRLDEERIIAGVSFQWDPRRIECAHGLAIHLGHHQFRCPCGTWTVTGDETAKPTAWLLSPEAEQAARLAAQQRGWEPQPARFSPAQAAAAYGPRPS